MTAIETAARLGFVTRPRTRSTFLRLFYSFLVVEAIDPRLDGPADDPRHTSRLRDRVQQYTDAISVTSPDQQPFALGKQLCLAMPEADSVIETTGVSVTQTC